MTTPEAYSSVQIHETPISISGLEAMEPGTVRINRFGSPYLGDEAKNCFTILVGHSQGRGFSGQYPYRRDPNAMAIRIVDIGDQRTNLFINEDNEVLRANFGVFTWRYNFDKERWIPKFDLLLPGKKHEILSETGDKLGDFEIKDSGEFEITRTEEKLEFTDARIVSTEHNFFIEKPPVSSPSAGPMGPLVVRYFAQIEDEEDTLKYDDQIDYVLDPGLNVAAVDARTGQTVTYILQRPILMPNGAPRRYEDDIANQLEKRTSRSQSSRRYDDGPRYRYRSL